MIGYACLNLTLQQQEAVAASRTCKMSTLLKSDNPIKHCIELARVNLENTLKILEWNVSHGIKMYRMSAAMFPFATHQEFRWGIEDLSDDIKRLSEFIKKNDMRVSAHLPQFINLGSPREEVVQKSVIDLEFYNTFFDAMNLDSLHKLVIHGGGVYEDRIDTLKRMVNVYDTLSDTLKKRVVFENDEKSWNISDLMDFHELTGATILFDYLHWEKNHRGADDFNVDLNMALSTWRERPKIHYSEQAEGRNSGAHSYLVERIIVSDRFDTMVEAKGKELAIMPFLNGEKSDSIITV